MPRMTIAVWGKKNPTCFFFTLTVVLADALKDWSTDPTMIISLAPPVHGEWGCMEVWRFRSEYQDEGGWLEAAAWCHQDAHQVTTYVGGNKGGV